MSDAPPRVIFVNRVYWPSTAATAQLLTDLAEGLAARGWQIDVIAAGTTPGPRHGVTIHRTGADDEHGGLWSRSRNYRRFARKAARLLAELARPGDLVVPMTDPPMLGATVIATASQVGAGVVHWTQDIYPEIVSAHFGAALALPLWPLRRRRDAAWRDARGCVVLGEGMAAEVAAHGVGRKRIAIIPNWAPRELEAPAPAADIAARRAAWGLGEKFIVAYSGNLGRVHEFAAVVAAAERLKLREDIAFLFIGAGARFDEVRAAAQARGLRQVHFRPPEPREHLAAALAAVDLHLVTLKPAFARLVYPSKLAGVLAAGRPVVFVGPTDGEIARLLAREQCGAAFAPADAHGLAEAIARCSREPAALSRQGAAARLAYERHFAFAPALAGWEAVLRRSRG